MTQLLQYLILLISTRTRSSPISFHPGYIFNAFVLFQIHSNITYFFIPSLIKCKLARIGCNNYLRMCVYICLDKHIKKKKFSPVNTFPRQTNQNC
ncbi:hypothetical protein BDF21DRAFT_429545 [Thamnidium elegans]|nr:hypothetical protein BDF21DRAFT_429545 [Thamnidium elegans]